MIITVTRSDFHDAFRAYGREDQFSYESRDMLFDYLEEHKDTDSPQELDVIALCVEWNESSAEELVREYGIEIYSDEDGAGTEAIEDYLNDHTILIGETKAGHFLYAAF